MGMLVDERGLSQRGIDSVLQSCQVPHEVSVLCNIYRGQILCWQKMLTVDIGTESAGRSERAGYTDTGNPLSSSWNDLFSYRVPIQRDLVENTYLCPGAIWQDCCSGRGYAGFTEHGWIDGDLYSWWQSCRNTCMCLQSAETLLLPPNLVSPIPASSVDVRVPEACAYTYQSYPASVKEGIPATFSHGLSELNGGLQIFKPSKEKFDRLLNVLNTSAPNEFLFADQSLLSKTFHGQWTPLYLPCLRCWSRPYIYNALKTLRTAHAPIWKDVAVILGKPWNDKDKTTCTEDTHAWWWEVDTERREKEKMVGIEEPKWG